MGDAGIKSAIQGSNVPNPDEAVPSFVSGAMAKAGKGLLEGTLQDGTSAVSDKLLDLVGLGGKSAADKGKDTRDYLAAAFPELRSEERFSRNAETDLVCRLLLEKKKDAWPPRRVRWTWWGPPIFTRSRPVIWSPSTG